MHLLMTTRRSAKPLDQFKIDASIALWQYFPQLIWADSYLLRTPPISWDFRSSVCVHW